MGFVLRHAHFCPACDEFRTCIKWLCSHQNGDELLCEACDQRKTPTTAAQCGCIIDHTATDEAGLPGTQRGPHIPGMAERVIPVCPGLSNFFDHVLTCVAGTVVASNESYSGPIRQIEGMGDSGESYTRSELNAQQRLNTCFTGKERNPLIAASVVLNSFKPDISKFGTRIRNVR